ncbi:hypothetical protein NE237_018775 [Protea cynaroides]|uniref:Uncharacterized protein n=1 Tax=Protea cynaroides TaxID=273540 RepID=A0A9Q0KAI0_9MAGN|nr:hypothetical protein NE237_018775 [Protea cynaroides]
MIQEIPALTLADLSDPTYLREAGLVDIDLEDLLGLFNEDRATPLVEGLGETRAADICKAFELGAHDVLTIKLFEGFQEQSEVASVLPIPSDLPKHQETTEKWAKEKELELLYSQGRVKDLEEEVWWLKDENTKTLKLKSEAMHAVELPDKRFQDARSDAMKLKDQLIDVEKA